MQGPLVSIGPAAEAFVGPRLLVKVTHIITDIRPKVNRFLKTRSSFAMVRSER